MRYVSRVQGHFDAGHYKEVRGIYYHQKTEKYQVNIADQYIGLFPTLKLAIYARDLYLYVNNRYFGAKRKGRVVRLYSMAYSRKFYDNMAHKMDYALISLYDHISRKGSLK